MTSNSVRRNLAESLHRAARERSGRTAMLLRGLSMAIAPPHIQEDPLYWWIESANAGLFDRGNHYLVDLAARDLRPGVVLEIGSFCGFSANVIRRCLDLHQRSNPLWTCDPWVWGEGAIEGSTVTYEQYGEFVKESFIRAVRTFSSTLPHSFQMTSGELFEHWRGEDVLTDIFGREVRCGGPLSFCFIDGEHDYENVKRDFEGCDEFLCSGGFLLFDDSSGYATHEVNRFIREKLPRSRYEVVERNPNYLVRRS
jgi:Methyltransferase domain